MIPHLPAAAGLVLLAASAATAQETQPLPLTAAGNRAGENAVRQAGDAFGTVIGQEEVGL
jgi:iron complex outermembrane recepter protein